MASSGTRRSTARRGLIGVAVVAVLLAGGLTAGWFYLAGELDRRLVEAIDVAAGEGTTIGCADREVFGYPFRLGLACSATTVEAPERGLSASAGALRTAAQIYDPQRIVAELEGPLAVNAPDLPPLGLDWTLAQSSVAFAGEGIDRVSLVMDEPSVALRSDPQNPVLIGRSTRLELHGRRNGPDLDLAFRDEGVVALLPAQGELPPFDLSLDMSVANGASLLAEGLPGGSFEEALRGRAGTLRSVRLALSGGGAAEFSGPFSISASGEISGDFEVAVEDPDAIAGLVATLVPGSAGVASAAVGALGFAGRQENGRTIVDIQVRDGEARLGFIPLGELPRI